MQILESFFKGGRILSDKEKQESFREMLKKLPEVSAFSPESFEEDYRNSAMKIRARMKKMSRNETLRIKFDGFLEKKRVNFYLESITENLPGFAGRMKDDFNLEIRRTK